MQIFESLLKNAGDSVSLDSYIQTNLLLVEEFCSTDIINQRSDLDNFERFVLFRTTVIGNLDYNKSYNRAFVYYLMDYCERFCSTSTVVQLYRIIEENKLNIGSRLNAAMLYLYNVSSNELFVDRFNDICKKLQTAIEEEEDDDKKVITSFLNYFSYVVYNTPREFSEKIVLKYSSVIGTNLFPFLESEIIKECFALDFSKPEEFYNTVQGKIDRLLGRNKEYNLSNIENTYLIEENTDYSWNLLSAERSFKSIRNISVHEINKIKNKDDIFFTLKRGVEVLEDEKQLYSYINSYGNMHEAKMLSALQHFPLTELDGKNIEVFDWACGQGLASVILQEFIDSHKINVDIKKITLIEPSKISLKRATLHVKHFNSACMISTILKDIDSVSEIDLNSDNNIPKIHLFSNILDVEGFSIEHLISIIEESQKGENYFVCVSPYITDAKTARIDKFVDYFAQKYDSFYKYFDIDSQKGEWKNNWTRAIRLFKVNI